MASVVGPSSCGKSTLTRLIADLLTPYSGSVWLFGEKFEQPRATVVMVFLNSVLLEWRTILQNVILTLEIVGSSLTANKWKERVRHSLALVGLDVFKEKRSSELSGGMRLGAAVCRACAKTGSTNSGWIFRCIGCLNARRSLTCFLEVSLSVSRLWLRDIMAHRCEADAYSFGWGRLGHGDGFF